MLKKNIAIVCRTIGLEYDDRIRKECLAISKNANLKIFVTFENNLEEDGVTSYGIPYKSFKLHSREKLKSGSLLLVKALEFFLRVKPYLKDYDLVWAHEEYTFVFPLFLKKGSFIWDLHEIPFRFENKIMKPLFRYMEKKSKYIIHANQYRINYLTSRGMVESPNKHAYIRNYPDKIFTKSILKPKDFEKFQEWLNNEPYVYLQGLTVADRFPYNSIASILEATSLKIIVVGTFEDLESKSDLERKFMDNLKERVYFAGRVNQLAIPSYLKDAQFSMIFYDTTDPNNEFCEANRFFQAINFGIPVITGRNASMASLVKDYGLGIALDTDGRDLVDIKNGIRLLLSNYNTYKQNCLKNIDTFVWKESDVKTFWFSN
jgi:hypothetical protein